ncbi:MAG: hypothetical protein KF841_11575 [Phycisphaerae bacterium]|nr:hypothetical protein [Phycisphaerae bacterium]
MNPETKRSIACTVITALALLTACDKRPADPSRSGGPAAVSTTPGLPTGLFLATEPANARTVEEVKSAAKTGDKVVVRGRIGGSKAPFVEGRAVFTLMGAGLDACSDKPGDECATPWDYCCDTAPDIAKHSVTVQVVDANGAPVKAEIRGIQGLKELSEVVVVGKLTQLDDKATIIAADAMHISKH